MVQIGAEEGPALEVLERPALVPILGVTSAEVLVPGGHPPLWLHVARLEDKLVDHLGGAAAGGGGLGGGLGCRWQRPKGPQRPVLPLAVHLARQSLPAPVLRPDVVLESAACVPELEHVGVGEFGQVDGVGVGHEVKGGVEQVARRHTHRHPRLEEGAGVGQRSGDPLDGEVWALEWVDVAQVVDHHQNQRVLRRRYYHAVAEDGVWLVLGVWLVGDEELAVLLGHLDDGVEALGSARDHVRVNIDAAVLVQQLQTQQVRLALPHPLLLVEVSVEHVQLGDVLVGPQSVVPVLVAVQVVHTPCVEPETGRLLGSHPDLVHHLGNGRCGGQVVTHGLLPLVGVREVALAVVPHVELTDTLHFGLEALVGRLAGVGHGGATGVGHTGVQRRVRRGGVGQVVGAVDCHVGGVRRDGGEI
mmetsp:Transcript_22983/g.56817  ORF Transcript_22983/g.56817 Transcript_22983/m.56817 type:complete len:416 (+) Transcript_22983:1235-2482(+)